MDISVKALVRSWIAIVIAGALAMALAVSWFALQAATTSKGPELQQTAEVIGKSIASEIDHALGYDIPLQQLAGVELWVADIVSANPVLAGVALADDRGTLLMGHKVPESLKNTLMDRRINRCDNDGVWLICTISLQGSDQSSVGWLHVVASAPGSDSKPIFAALVAALAIAAAMSIVVMGLANRQLLAPLKHCRRAVADLVQGNMPDLRAGVARNAATALESTLAVRLQQVLDENKQVLLKAGEVRAAHFDPQVLQRLDELAAPLASRHLQAHERLLGVANQFDPRMSVVLRIVLASMAALAVVVMGAYGINWVSQKGSDRSLVTASGNALAVAWQATKDRDQNLFSAKLDDVLASAEVIRHIEQQNYDALSELLRSMDTQPMVLTLAHLDARVLASSVRVAIDRPDRVTLAPLVSGPAQISGVWQDMNREYLSGAARRITRSDGENLVIMASQPLRHSLSRLEQRMTSPIALADLRGQPVLETSAETVKEWRVRGRKGYVGTRDGAQVVVSSLTLDGASGHMMGTLLAEQRVNSANSAESGLRLLILAAIVGTCLALMWYLYGALAPQAAIARRLLELAEGDAQETNAQGNAVLNAPRLNRAIMKIDDKIEALNTLRRSKSRQGQRQARFIRQQMMQLASRLDQKAREGILSDLDRIEHAGNASAGSESGAASNALKLDPRLEKIVDEVGILALGFQNLVSRVGDQYQELDRLVNELREALRVKTQFIAIQQELDIASKMQLSFLPRPFHSRDGLSLKARMVTAKEVGGDFFDFFALDEHRVALVMADVSGKGVPAALFMAVSRTLMRAVAPLSASPGECLERLNDLLASDNAEMMFVTLFYAVIDTRDGRLSYANAGHNPPYLLHADGTLETIKSTGNMALAVMEGLPYENRQLMMAPGDSLFLFTDGVTEAFDPQQQLYGEARLEDLLRSMQKLPPEEVPDAVIAEIKKFEAGGPQSDDITCLIAYYEGKE
jgi:sigma-B regulation protein RsbU (phosphoserine phosphatase)